MSKWIIGVIAIAVLGVGIVSLSNVSVDPQSQMVGPAASGVIPGQDIPDVSTYGYVADLANVLGDSNAVLPLVNKLKAYDASGKGQMAVLTVKSLNGLSIEEYGIRVGEKWKVGKQGVDDGIIVIVSTGDRKVRIEVGRGAAITDAQAGKILSDAMVPKLKKNDWSGAINDGVDAIIALTSK